MTEQPSSSPVLRNWDGSVMLDHRGRAVYRNQFLSTRPLRSDCKERVGCGGGRMTYVTGHGIIRSMNTVFGHSGWGTEITMEREVQCEKDGKGRWVVGYLARVRIALKEDGRTLVSHEDCGSGEGINESKIKAHEKALKSAITDAMKRAARHFGERLGNALYVKTNTIRNAPKNNKEALDDVEKQNCLEYFGNQDELRELHRSQKRRRSSSSNTDVNGPGGICNMLRQPSEPFIKSTETGFRCVNENSFPPFGRDFIASGSTCPADLQPGQNASPINESNGTVSPSCSCLSAQKTNSGERFKLSQRVNHSVKNGNQLDVSVPSKGVLHQNHTGTSNVDIAHTRPSTSHAAGCTYWSSNSSHLTNSTVPTYIGDTSFQGSNAMMKSNHTDRGDSDSSYMDTMKKQLHTSLSAPLNNRKPTTLNPYNRG